MALIYLVQSSTELCGEAGYSYGLLQGEHPRLLVTFAEYAGKNRQHMFKNGDRSLRLGDPNKSKNDSKEQT